MWELLCAFSPTDPGRTAYNVFAIATWDFPVDRDRFQAAVDEVMRRHDALRIVFTDTSLDPRIRVAPEVDTTINYTDLTDVPAQRRAVMQSSILAYERARTFDLRTGPLWRATLLRLGESQHVVAVTMTHVISDGRSADVFLRDLRAAYLARGGQGPPLPPLRLTYPAAQAALALDEAQLRQRQEYWRRSLTPLPTEWPYPPILDGPGLDVSAESDLAVPIPADVTTRFRAFARRHRTTPFVLLLAAYRIYLAVRTGWSRVIVATASTGRESLPAGGDDLIGQFSQNTYLATTIDLQTTLTDAIAIVRAGVYEAMRNQASFWEIARAANPDFDAMRPWPFFHLYHAWMHGAAFAVPQSAHRVTRMRPPPVEPDAALLWLWARRHAPGLTVDLDGGAAVMGGNPTMYPASLVREILQGYVAVLKALVADPEQRIADLKLP